MMMMMTTMKTTAFRIEQLICFVLFEKKNYILWYFCVCQHCHHTEYEKKNERRRRRRNRRQKTHNESKEDKKKRNETNELTKAILKWTYILCSRKRMDRMISPRWVMTGGYGLLLLLFLCRCNLIQVSHLLFYLIAEMKPSLHKTRISAIVIVFVVISCPCRRLWYQLCDQNICL